MKKRTFRVNPVSLAGAALIVLSSSAFGSLTEVIFNRFGQPDPRQIVSHVYNDTVSAVGEDFSGSTISATRIPDGSSAEALAGQQFVANAVARFSDYTQSYGVIDSNGSFTPAFDVSGKNFNVTGSGTIDVASGQSFGRSGNSGTDSSTPSQNADNRDHVVTYKIDGAKPDPQYLQFWEDLNISPGLAKGRTTSDFNDLVVKLEPAPAGAGGGATVPLPPAVWSAGALGVAMLIQRCRRTTERQLRPFRR